MPDLDPASADTSPRPASTLVLVRDAAAGPEVLLLRRAESGDHNSGAWVFPGGLVEPRDHVSAACSGLTDAEASSRLQLAEGGLAFHVAAVRECFEECGLLLAVDAACEGLRLEGERAARIDAWRGPLYRGERSLEALCRAEGLTLALDRLAYIGHWLTPVGLSKRFDTRFFVATAPPAQTAAHDAGEIVEQRWWRPDDALAAGAKLKLLTPTRKTLEQLSRFENVDAVMAWARSLRAVPLTMPRLGTGRQGPRPVMPDEPAWAELGRLDAAGRGDACYDIRPGVAVRLSPRIVRVTADNGTQMTGPGTNGYLVGGGERNEWAVIDPGPLGDAQVQALLQAAPGPIRWIFATHTHADHSPATVALKAATGATVHGRLPLHSEWQDASFTPDVALQGGERIALPGCGVTLEVVHTPGHASNHLCYLLEQERTLFTGDHVMQLSTVVINPPDGDMAAYLASLQALLARDDIDWLAPGHGFLIAEPKRAFAAIVAHRLKREAKVLSALAALGPVSAEALLIAVYDDVPVRLHGMAMRSLKAHLLKLQQEARASERAHRWSA